MKIGLKRVTLCESYAFFQKVMNDIDKAEDQLLDDEDFNLDDDF